MSEFDKFLIKGEMLEAMALTYIDKQDSYCLQVNPDQNSKTEYFKFFNNVSWVKATKLCRISFREPKYIIHTNSHKVDDWLLTKKEQKYLIKVLWSDSKKYKGYSVWQALIIDYNAERYSLPNDISEKLTITKQQKLARHVNLSEVEGLMVQALPIDLPMPNYLKLH